MSCKRILIATTFLLSVLLAGCGDDKHSPSSTPPASETTTPPGGQTGNAAEEERIRVARNGILQRLDTAETRTLNQIRQLRDFSPEKEQKVKDIYNGLREKVRNYRATSADDLFDFVDAELRKVEDQLRREIR